jgi:hypothetical protein
MFKRNLVAAVAAMGLVSAPAIAQSSASKLSVASAVRASASTDKESNLGGSLVLIGLAVAAAAVAIYVIADDDDSASS